MKRLFTPDGEAALTHTMRQRPLLAFDFDGTLAPIVARPDDARVPAGVAHRLQRLAQRLPVAVISGRRLLDLRPRLLFTPWRVVGNHGAEDESALRAAQGSAALAPARAQLAGAAAALHTAGVMVEDKGLSIALHYRLAVDREAARRAIDQVLAALPAGLKVFGGKMVVNLVAAWARDKADAVADLAAESGSAAAVFIGDDVNDEPVFARGEPGWLTVRVGQDDPDSAAQWFLDGPADLPRLLDQMLLALPEPPSAPP